MFIYIEEKLYLSLLVLIFGRYSCCKKYLKNLVDGIFNIV